MRLRLLALIARHFSDARVLATRGTLALTCCFAMRPAAWAEEETAPTDEAVVFDQVTTRYDMELDAKTLLWSGRMQADMHLVVNHSRGLQNRSFVLRQSSLVKIGAVKVRIQRTGKWHDVELEVHEQAPWTGYHAFDDDILRTYTIPDIRVGDRIHIEYERKYSRFWEIPAHTFGRSEPTRREVLEIRVPKQLDMAAQELPGLLGEPVLVHKRSESGGSQLLLWEAGPCRGLGERQKNVPPPSEVLPMVRVAALRIRRDGAAPIPVRSSWSDFAKWYESRVQSQLLLDDDLRRLVLLEKQAAPSPVDLVDRLYRIVQSRVRYVAYEVGEGGWIPRPATATLSRNYGDCKDMSTLLVAMLREAGIPAHLALVSSRASGRRVSTEFPYCLQFDHCVAFADAGTGVWLDATGPGPSSEVPSFISAQPALVIDGDATRFVQPKHEDQNASECRQHFQIHGAGSGHVRVRFDFEWRGPAGYDFRRYRDSAGADKLVARAREILSQAFRNVRDITLDDVPRQDGAGAAAAAVVIASTARLSGECTVLDPLGSPVAAPGHAGDWILPSGLAGIDLPMAAPSRRLPYLIRPYLVTTCTIQMRLPQPVQADSTAVHLSDDLGTFELRTAAEGDILRSTRSLRWNEDLVLPSEMAAFHRFIRSVNAANDRKWRLKRR